MSKKFVGVLSTASNAPFGVFNEGDCRELVIIRHSWHTTSSTEAHHRRRNTELSTGVLMDLQGRDSMDLRGIHQRLTQLTTLIGSTDQTNTLPGNSTTVHLGSIFVDALGTPQVKCCFCQGQHISDTC
uniref:CACTA en-spm transposon protein n=1 Tax=Caenorhabditis tropicalis TaxID=1561998 RepID=A0A1I7TTR4_9PELO